MPRHASPRAAVRRAGAALAALALLLGAACERAAPSNCTLLAAAALEKRPELYERSASVAGRPASVTLVWGSSPARAGAALLRALLTRVHRHARVRLARGPHRTAALAAYAPFNPSAGYTDLVIGVSTAWTPEAPRPWWPSDGEASGLAGPRLSEFGASPIAARRRLFARIAPAARARAACGQSNTWSFYHNNTALQLCDFVAVTNPQGNVSAVEIVGVGDCNVTLQRLQERVAAPLRARLVSRADFLRTLRTANHSFLFLDYDIWKGEPSVSAVKPPPCVPLDSDCQQELDSAIAVRVADVEILQTYAPQLFKFVYDFNPTPDSLRQILEQEANGTDIEEAACAWALTNKSYVIRNAEFTKYDVSNYTVAIYVCTGDPNNIAYDNITNVVGTQILKTWLPRGRSIHIRRYFMNCSDEYNMSKRLDELTSTAGIYKLLGVVSLAVEGAAAASVVAAARRVPLLLAAVAPDVAADATWRVAGRPRHVARALLHFVRESGWTRLAVLSQSTPLARDYYAALEDNTNIILREYSIQLNLKKQQAEETFQDIRAANARIIFVNADFNAAVLILAAAVERNMSYSDGFVWIVREWRQNNIECSTKHFTVSLWTRGAEDIPPDDGQAALRRKLEALFRGRLWPPRTVPFADALLTLTNGFTPVFQRYPNTRQDLRSAEVIRALNESLIETPVTGVSQLLHYKERSIEETFVFVDQWCGGQFKQRLATWRVNASSDAVRGKSGARANCTRPADMPRDDGASSCKLRSGDEFDPDCYDTVCAVAAVLVILVLATLLLAHRVLRRHLARLKQKQKIDVIARRRHVASVLAEYLVERDTLELCEELGAGRFGSVRLARLSAPAHSPRYIAAKALRENAAPAEESEFLREACTIASLNHAHIVRLVGVCIADGPPLVLMELAFFGDLLGYLRARRHLAEGSGAEALAASGEAEHVSAEALTRLAREAAEALQYLGVRGVVHRDVRAANCLVDVRRSLKLADFGMARDTVAGADGAPEYACRRRGLFPVLWMAPESLARGVFSAASDVWALGVLVLELVTLGARPYGSMSPLRVLEYVAAGGSPPLPLDATPQTRGLARLCWQRAAERRPSAAEVAAYLAAGPRALRPALLSERDEPADADSGYGESRSIELLPPPLHSLDQLEVLAATH